MSAPTARPGKTSKHREAHILDMTLEAKLRMYSITAAESSRAGAAIMAGLMIYSQLADARVIGTKANQTLSSNLTKVDLNNDGIPDILIEAYNNFSEGSCFFIDYGGINAYGAQSGNAILVNHRGAGVPGKRGQEVEPYDPFASEAELNAYIAEGGCSDSGFQDTSGPWLKMSNRFLGVKFLINGETHYGWLRMNVAGPNSGLLTGYAYETEPNTPIVAGFKNFDDMPMAQIKVSANPSGVPRLHKKAPVGLGALGMGARGLQLWRQDNASKENH